MRKSHFIALDSLRTIAFLLVYLSHACYPLIKSLAKEWWTPLMRVFLENGDGAVSIFFVLSGFLIHYKLLLESGKIKLAEFYFNRVLRILPLYFFFLAFVMFILYPHLTPELGGIGTNDVFNPLYYIFFLNNFDIIRVTQETGGHELLLPLKITWALAVIEQFYFFAPLCFLFFKKRYAYFLTAVFFGSSIFAAINSHDMAIRYYHSFSVWGHFAAGGLAAYIFVKRPVLLNKKIIATIYILGLGLMIYRLSYPPIPYFNPLSRALLVLFFTFVVWDQATNARLGRLWFFAKAAKYTYGLYLFHAVAIVLLTAWWGNEQALAIALAGGLPLSFLAAYLCYHAVEKPFLKRKADRLDS